jgi:transposase-like protein
MSRTRYTKELKLEIVKEHYENGISFYKLGKDNGIDPTIVRDWCRAYDTHGEDGLRHHDSNRCNYSAEFKEQVAKEYLAGGVAAYTVAKKYGILAPSTVRKWAKEYNDHGELTDSRTKGDLFMIKDNKSRKTTLEERIAAVEYCLSNENNYALTAKEFNCSYGQVYSWVKKYNSAGVAGLYDRRGRSKDAEELTEIEKLKAENRLLKAQAKQQQMEIDFLKKLDAVERR